MDPFDLSVVVFIGLLLGSFCTALIYRVPRKIDWVFKRSSCTSCKKALGARDLVPVFSWVLNRGRCRHCGKGVSWIYPLIELLVLVACVLVYWRFGLREEGLFLIVCVPFLMALTVIDFQKMILPNQLVFACFALGFFRLLFFSFSGVFVAASDIVVPYIFGAVVYLFISMALRHSITFALGREALGRGDVKFFSVAGLWLGLANLPMFFIITGIMGIAMAVFWRVIVRRREFPFGPALISAMFFLLLLRGPILP